MKRMVALILLFSVLSVISFCVIGSIVGGEKANVTIKENIIYGDKSYADGVTVFTRAHYDEHLFWDTSYTIGDGPKTVTDYMFSYFPHYEEEDVKHQGLYLDVDFKYGYSTNIPLEECVGLQKAYRELYDATPEGSKGSKTIRLQDYYDYYPVRVEFDLPGVLWQGRDYKDLAFSEFINERKVWDKFNAFFRIPIPEDLPAFEITITKKGNSVGVGSTGHDNDYWFDPQTAYASDRVFFSISNKFYNGDREQYVDVSLIPGGYGIYALSYKNVRNSENTQGNSTIFYPGYETGVEEETLEMVFPLEQYAEVIYMTLSNDESKLLVFTKEYDVTYLTVIEVSSMAKIQKLKVTEAKQYAFYEYGNCIVLNGWEDISVIEKQADGLCRLAFTVSRMKEVNDSNLQKGVATTMAFDGEKLVMVDRTGDAAYPGLETCGFTVAVYNETGLVYYAKYESSLSAATNPHNYAFNCLPIQYAVALPE